MVCRVIDFAPVVLKLLMSKVWGIVGISKTEFFNFSSTERVKKYLGYKLESLSEHARISIQYS